MKYLKFKKVPTLFAVLGLFVVNGCGNSPTGHAPVATLLPPAAVPVVSYQPNGAPAACILLNQPNQVIYFSTAAMAGKALNPTAVSSTMTTAVAGNLLNYTSSYDGGSIIKADAAMGSFTGSAQLQAFIVKNFGNAACINNIAYHFISGPGYSEVDLYLSTPTQSGYLVTIDF
jgi:hypothetical protein